MVYGVCLMSELGVTVIMFLFVKYTCTILSKIQLLVLQKKFRDTLMKETAWRYEWMVTKRTEENLS